MSDLAALADGLIDRIETACHERSIWNYEAAEDAEKELARFCAEHKAALLAALRASRRGLGAVCNSPEPAADAVEAMARAMFLIPTPNPGRGSILPFAEQPTVIRNVWLERARAALSALPRPEADEGAVRKADEIFDDITRGGPTVDAVMREDWATVAEWMRQRAEDGLAVTRAALAAAQEGQP